MPNSVRLQVTALILLQVAVLVVLVWAGAIWSAALWVGFGLCLYYIYLPKFDPFGQTFWRGGKQSNLIALTFDDGPDPRSTPVILDLLKEMDVRASFFPLGKFAQENPGLIRRIAEEGHELGSHGYSHRKFSRLGPKAIREELRNWESVISPPISLPNRKWLRPPHGFTPLWLPWILRKTGYRLAGWSRGVWDTDMPGTEAIVERVVNGTRGGEVILLHDGDGSGRGDDRSQTVSAVKPLVSRLKEKGFSFVTLTELEEKAPKKDFQWGRLIGGLIISAAIIYFFAQRFDWPEVRSHITVAAPIFLLGTITLDLLCLLAKSQSWRQLVLPLQPVGKGLAFSIYLIGTMLNNIFPFRMGDLGRVDLLKRSKEVRRLHGVSTVMLEMVLQGLSLLPVLFLTTLFIPLPSVLGRATLGFVLLILLVFAGLFGLAPRSKEGWWAGLSSLRMRGHFLRAYGLAVLGWTLYFASLTCMFFATGLEVSPWAAPIIALALAASMFIPAAPGRIGPFEAAIVLALSMFGVKTEQALGFALVLHTVQVVPSVIWGTIAWGKRAVSAGIETQK